MKRQLAFYVVTEGADLAILDMKCMMQERRPEVRAAATPKDPISLIPYAEPCRLNAILRAAKPSDWYDKRFAPAEGTFFPGKWVLNDRLTWKNFPAFNWMDLYGNILPPGMTRSRYRPQETTHTPISTAAPDLLAIADIPMSLPRGVGETRQQFWTRVDVTREETPEGWENYDLCFRDDLVSQSSPSHGWVHRPETARPKGQGGKVVPRAERAERRESRATGSAAAAPVSVSSDESDPP